jgi:hypothetical protein
MVITDRNPFRALLTEADPVPTVSARNDRIHSKIRLICLDDRYLLYSAR